jgi:protease I
MKKKILIFVHKIYEEMELHYPRYRLLESGFDVVVAGPKKGEEYKGKQGFPCIADASFEEINESDFEGVIIPGGYAPDKLRGEKKVLELVRSFHANKKMIAFICHAGWVPISAGILKGVECTSWHLIKDDLVNAGAKWRDEKVVVDGHIISSRCPADLPDFSKAMLQFLEKKPSYAKR